MSSGLSPTRTLGRFRHFTNRRPPENQSNRRGRYGEQQSKRPRFRRSQLLARDSARNPAAGQIGYVS
jgi:hypothetical protein